MGRPLLADQVSERAGAPPMPMCALGPLVTRVRAMTSAVVARLVYRMLLARDVLDNERDA
jgi:hypothetical protein